MISDKDYSPLSTACVRALNDKVYDKRKVAALEVEKMTRDFVNAESRGQINRLISVLSKDMAMAPNPNMRKGGLIGLASMAVGLGKEIGPHTVAIAKAILPCLHDTDSRVRFYAIESLFNVVKVAREHILPVFKEIFIGTATAITDVDLSARQGAESLDKALKDVVTETQSFDMVGFIEVLRERIYTQDGFARGFYLGWIEAAQQMPNSTMEEYLPEFLDALFLMLGDSHQDIYSKAENVLGQFLTHIKAKPDNIQYPKMMSILIVHAQSREVRIQIIAVFWMKEFIKMSGFAMLPYTSGILLSTLSNSSFEGDRRRMVTEEEYREIKNLSKEVNDEMMRLVKAYEEQKPDGKLLELNSVLKTLIDELGNPNSQDTKPAILRWMYHLFSTCPQKMAPHVDVVFPHLLNALSEGNDEVVILDLQILAEICGDSEPEARRPHFEACIKYLSDLFRKNQALLESKGPFIIRELCLLLSPKEIFQLFAANLAVEKNLPFARQLVSILNLILISAPELRHVRTELKDLSTKESIELFCCLYKSWCHCPTAAVALCLFSGCYGHAGDLLKVISEQPVTVETQKDLDQLAQLIDSSMFTFLRVRLLDVDSNDELIYALHLLLMLMPQVGAYQTLKSRLSCVPAFQSRISSSGAKRKTEEHPKNRRKDINFNQLMDHFKEVLELHWVDSENDRRKFLESRGVQFLNLEKPSS